MYVRVWGPLRPGADQHREGLGFRTHRLVAGAVLEALLPLVAPLVPAAIRVDALGPLRTQAAFRTWLEKYVSPVICRPRQHARPTAHPGSIQGLTDTSASPLVAPLVPVAARVDALGPARTPCRVQCSALRPGPSRCACCAASWPRGRWPRAAPGAPASLAHTLWGLCRPAPGARPAARMPRSCRTASHAGLKPAARHAVLVGKAQPLGRGPVRARSWMSPHCPCRTAGAHVPRTSQGARSGEGFGAWGVGLRDFGHALSVYFTQPPGPVLSAPS